MTAAIEERLAREIVTLVPSIEKIRFVSSGAEATMSAARLARGYTGRPIIVKFTGHYPGHADYFLVGAGWGVAGLGCSWSYALLDISRDASRNSGHTACLPFNGSEQTQTYLNAHCESIAAVILEPVAASLRVVPAHPEFMQMLWRKTRDLILKFLEP